MLRRFLPVGAAALALGLAAAPAHAAPGQPDPGFGSGGVAAVGIDGRSAAEPAPGGGVVVAGNASTETDNREGFAVVKLREDGTPDPSFGGGDGRAVLEHPAATWSWLDEHAVDGEGRTVVLGHGTIRGVGSGETLPVVQVARLLPDGTLDPGFGSGGWVLLEDGPQPRGRALAVRAGGRLVAGLGSRLVGLRADGEPDAGFGAGGDVRTPRTEHVAVDGEDRLVIADETSIERLAAGGSADPSFGGGAPVTVAGGGIAFVRVDPAGRIVAGAAQGRHAHPEQPGPPGYGQWFVDRFLSTGEPDPAFGERGRFASERFEEPVALFGMDVDAASRAVLLPVPRQLRDGGYTATRLTAAGALDAAFDRAGVPAGFRFAGGVAHDAAGNLLVGGSSAATGTAVLRLQGDPPPATPEPAPLVPAAPPRPFTAGPPAPDRTAPVLALRRRGLRVVARCSEPARVTAKVLLGARAARRLGVGRRVARAGAGCTRKAALRLRLNRRARRVAGRVRRAGLRIVVVAADAAGNRSTHVLAVARRR